MTKHSTHSIFIRNIKLLSIWVNCKSIKRLSVILICDDQYHTIFTYCVPNSYFKTFYCASILYHGYSDCTVQNVSKRQ